MSLVYILREANERLPGANGARSNLFKIGKGQGAIEDRIAALQTGNHGLDVAHRGRLFVYLHGLGGVATGAELTASGAARLSADTLVLSARDLSGSFCLFYQGAQLVAPFAADDGRNCAGASILRLATRAVSGGARSYPMTGDAGLGTVGQIPSAGATRIYQAWYRNSDSFCTPATSNRSNGVAVAWYP